ncbi:hypothetical protein Y1Q_0021500 [Alligator mississippiensis]|uniref:Uncharacterized protein n=1 Tax=Alligator mississippiensis TaxID=8496 RepID=A0A151P9T5_ALLMI|nr:hypothetical protein Y1Q_0021500 [Alligator mississippiensis]
MEGVMRDPIAQSGLQTVKSLSMTVLKQSFSTQGTPQTLPALSARSFFDYAMGEVECEPNQHTQTGCQSLKLVLELKYTCNYFLFSEIISGSLMKLLELSSGMNDSPKHIFKT